MTIAVRTAPPPGSAIPGDLYADLQSRTLWLGVDPAVDPARAVLVSDIVALMDAINDAETQANAYTDTKILTRAPTVHTHTSAQITDFTSAVQAIAGAMPALQFTRGMIQMWSGSLSQIGVGDLSGWALCDGSNGTPDLRDRFVIGAGNKPVGDKNALTSTLVTDTKGAHNHAVDGFTLTLTHIPAHGHGPGNMQGYITGATGAELQGFNHNIGSLMGAYTGPGVGAGSGGTWGPVTGTTGTQNQNHTHNISGSAYMNGGATANAGGSQAHTHTITDGAGGHTHTMTMNAVREATPYFALAFIMKL